MTNTVEGVMGFCCLAFTFSSGSHEFPEVAWSIWTE